MIGIVLISHGNMSEGMVDSASMFFGKLEQVVAVSFEAGEDLDCFKKKVIRAIYTVDKGDGIIVLTDILGGTTSNCVMSIIKEKMHIITGMNLPIFVEILGARLNSSDVDIDLFIKTGQNSIIYANQILTETCENELNYNF